jgi:hypothetical protein
VRQFQSVETHLIACAAILFVLTSTSSRGQEPRTAFPTPIVEKARLLPGKYAAGEPTLAADTEGRVVIVAIEGSDRTVHQPRLMLWRSEDGGSTWLAPSYLHDSRNFAKQWDPWLQSLALRKFSIVYVAGSNERPDLGRAVFQRSEDGGKSWTEPRTFHRWVDKTVMAASPSGKELVLTFTTFDADGGSAVQLYRSIDQGNTWQELPATFTGKRRYNAFGIVVTDEGAVAIGWEKQLPPGDSARRSAQVVTTTTNGGKDWKETEFAALPDNIQRPYLAGPALALDGTGRVHAVSVQMAAGKGKLDLFLRSTRDFLTWSEPFALAQGKDADYRGYPAIAATETRIHVAWLEGRNGKYHIWYRGSTDAGKTWSNALLLSQPEHPFGLPSGHYIGLAEDGKGTVHVAWEVRFQGLRGEIWHNIVRWNANERSPAKTPKSKPGM